MTRRVFDLVVALTILMVTAIPLILVAMLVKLTSPGPVFFRQERVGQEGKPFPLLKFRTMRAARSGALVTAHGDPRITPFGRFLRRTKIDEIPQLFNVVRGEMSIIGPRPEVAKFVAAYSEKQQQILKARPGLASMAQLVYPNEYAFLARFHERNKEMAYVRHLVPRKLAVDLDYEARRTMWTDIGLILEVVLLLMGIRRRVDQSIDQAGRSESEPAPRA